LAAALVKVGDLIGAKKQVTLWVSPLTYLVKLSFL
jgi:hypothetical protein